MYKVSKRVLVLLAACAYVNTTVAQWLEAKSEKDERSVSIKVRDGVPSSRVIVSSSLSLSYSSNMGDVTNETVGYGEVNGINSDTIYFYLVDDYKRTLTISAEGYPAVSLPFVLAPKETYRCFVFDPNKKEEEMSATTNTTQWQFEMAQNFDFGRDGFGVDQIEALNWYTKAAEQGHGLSQVTLGVKYASGGDGFSKDAMRSARWFLIAAQQNYDTAQYAIANCFLQGNGVKQDLANAYLWFQQAADKGIDEARYKMANMLLDGFGSEEQLDELLGWFAFFAEENRSEAQHMYAKLLLNRKPSPESEATAVEYLNRAIALSNVDAMLMSAERCFIKDNAQYNVVRGMELLRMAEELNSGEAKSMIASYEKSLSREEVFIYTKDFADRGNTTDMATLAKMYYYGDGVELNYDTAFSYFSKSSSAEVVNGYIGLGLCYYYGFGVKRNYDEAFDNLTKGSTGADNIAIATLGLCYYYGRGVAANYDKAFELFTKANDGLNGISLNGLGLCYYNGQPVAKNIDKAISLFESAIKLDKYNAGLSLGDHYSQASSFDAAKAKDNYFIAAQEGNYEAQNKLGLLIFEQGVRIEFRNITRNSRDTVYIMPDEPIVNNSLEWFKKSSDRGYLKGEYNHAHCFVVALSKEEIKGSLKGIKSADAFRTLAEKGYKDAMTALATYHKFDIGVDIAEAYKWSQMATESSTGDAATDALYKGLLGCLEFDEAEAIAAATESTKEQILEKSAETMTAAVADGCTFVIPRLYTYRKEMKKDKNAAKTLSKHMDTLTPEQMKEPVVISFKR